MFLISGPPASGKTQKLWQSLKQSLERGRKVLLLVPTRMLRDKWEMELAQYAGGLLGNVVLTFNQYLEYILDSDPATRNCHRLSDFESYLVIRNLLTDNATELKYFRSLRQQPGLIRLIYSMVMELHQGHPPGTPWQISSSEPKWQDLQLLLNRYRDTLEQHGLLDTARAHWQAASLMDAGAVNEIQDLFLDGFYNFSRTQEHFLTALLRAAEQHQCGVWLTLPEMDNRSVQHAREQLLQNFNWTQQHCSHDHPLQSLNQACNLGQPYQGPVQVTRIAAFGVYREVEQVANQIHRLRREAGLNYSDIAVLTLNPDRYQAAVRSLFRDYAIPYYPARDESLRTNPLIMFLRNLMQYGVEGLDNTSIMSLAHAGYLLPALAEGLMNLNRYYGYYFRGRKAAWMQSLEQKSSHLEAQIELAVQEDFSGMQRQEEINRRMQGFLDFRSALEELLQVLFLYEADSRITPGSFIDWVSRLLECMVVRPPELEGEPAMASRDFMALRKLKDSLSSLRKSLYILGSQELTLPEYLSLFDEMIRDMRYRYRFYDPGAVQILTPYDSRELSFRAVFILGLNEGDFPGPVNFTLSDGHERRQLNQQAGRLLLDDADLRSAEMDLEFYTAIARSREFLFLCHTPFDEKGRQILPSLYLDDLLSFCPDHISLPLSRDHKSDDYQLLFRIVPDSSWMDIHYAPLFVRYEARHFAAGLEQKNSGMFPAWEEARRIAQFQTHREGINRYFSQQSGEAPQMYGEGRIDFSRLTDQGKGLTQALRDLYWSASRIEKAGNCRYAFFLTEILRLKPDPPAQEEIRSDYKGRYYHRVLELYGQQTAQAEPEQLPDYPALEEALQTARQEMEAALGQDTLFTLEGDFYRRVLRSFIRLEKEFRGERRIRHLEYPVNAVLIDSGSHSFSLGGRIDRVDDNGGRISIIDYKSRTLHSAATLLRPLFINQGILYAHVLGLAIEEIYYLSIEKEEIMPLLEKSKVEDWGTLWGQKQGELSALLDLLYQGDFSPWTRLQDLPTELQTFYQLQPGHKVKLEWEEKCQYCQVSLACPRSEKLTREW